MDETHESVLSLQVRDGRAGNSPDKFLEYLHDQAIAESSVRKYITYIEKIRGKSSLDIDDLNRFIRKHNNWYVRVAITHYLKFLGKADMIPYLAKIKKREPKPRTLPTIHDFRRIIQTIGGEEKIICEFLLCTGCRIHEIFKLKMGAVDFENKEIVLETKGGKYRKISLPENVLNLLIQKRDDAGILNNEYVFYTESKGTLESKRVQFFKRLQRHTRNLTGKSIGTHDFRRYFGSYLYEQTKDLQLVQRILGHTDPKTTIRYTQYATTKDDIERAKRLSEKLIQGNTGQADGESQA